MFCVCHMSYLYVRYMFLLYVLVMMCSVTTKPKQRMLVIIYVGIIPNANQNYFPCLNLCKLYNYISLSERINLNVLTLFICVLVNLLCVEPNQCAVFTLRPCRALKLCFCQFVDPPPLLPFTFPVKRIANRCRSLSSALYKYTSWYK